MNDFNKILINYFSEEELNKIKKTKLLIIGCGGLGSNIANILIRTGFCNIVLIDFDKVEMKNLNRQIFLPGQCGNKKVFVLKENLLKINSKAKIKAINKKIDRENLKKIILKEKPDIVIEAVDNEQTKKFIFEEAIKLNKKVICASGIAGFGDCENIKIKRGKNFVIAGDMIKSIKNFKPLAPKVAAVAAIQADEVLRMVLK
jgi:sulfur carrier protein ThiS adenylyltransferase